MLEKLLAIFSGPRALQEASDHFSEMLDIVQSMTLEASAVYWGRPMTADELTALYDRDVKVNKLQRAIRREIVANLSDPTRKDVPYCLLLMSLVKDVERVGDYAKNLVDIQVMCGHSDRENPRVLPTDPVTQELREIAYAVERFAREAPLIYRQSRAEPARQLATEGRSIAKRCDAIIPRIAGMDYSAAIATDLVLAVRFYKRISAHFMNLLSSVLMPLDKLDYYDEDVAPYR